MSAASHSVASHLAVSPAKYDAHIRGLIPLYDELIAEAARALDHAARPVRTVVDLGIGTGALARACLDAVPAARIRGIDADEGMMAIARNRLGSRSRRVTMTTGSFLREDLPPCDAIVASYALHHIRTAREKLAFYRRCHRALRRGGVLINGDCAPASTPRGFARDLDVWFTHLGRTFGTRAKGRRVACSIAPVSRWTCPGGARPSPSSSAVGDSSGPGKRESPLHKQREGVVPISMVSFT